MAKAKIRIAYTGEALDNGAMDVKNLAPALMAFGELVVRANEVIGNTQQVRVMLKADDIKKGSFEINMELVQSGIEQLKLLIGAADASGLGALLTVLGWADLSKDILSGVFSLIKKIAGRKIQKVEDNGTCIKIVIENQVICTDYNTFKVYMDSKARESVAKIVAPVAQDGIDGFELRDPGNLDSKEAIESITKDVLNLFEAPETEVVEQEQKPQVMILKIANLSFMDENKWRFTDGNGNYYWMKIEDKAFLNDVTSRRARFACGDMLELEFVLKQRIFPNMKISNEYTVIKVLRIIQAPTQIKLDIE